MEPEFFHINKEDIPHWIDNGVNYKLIAGEILGRKSPFLFIRHLFFGSQKYTSGRPGNHSWRLSFRESSLYILEGNIESEGNLYTKTHPDCERFQTLSFHIKTGFYSLYFWRRTVSGTQIYLLEFRWNF
jgi:redox-sensitive bicupin YhaK (pirin superfamily)